MAALNLIFSNKTADIYYNPDNKILTATYHGIVEYDALNEAIAATNNIAIKRGIYGGLIDVTKLAGSYHRLIEYMEKIGFPLLVENGYRAQAQIISNDLIMKNLTSKVGEIMGSLGVNFKTFTTKQEGEKWLHKILLEGK